jgi:hypothetical protein
LTDRRRCEVTTGIASELDRFVEGFRDEHRAARDALLGIARALRARDRDAIGKLMMELDAGVGPHMRYEEEVMYPALTAVFGTDYIERMLEDHDRGYGMGARLMEIASQDPITEEGIEEGVALIQRQLPHITDCDGLVLAIEVLPEERQLAICRARDRALAEPITMTAWGERRGREPIPAP